MAGETFVFPNPWTVIVPLLVTDRNDPGWSDRVNQAIAFLDDNSRALEDYIAENVFPIFSYDLVPTNTRTTTSATFVEFPVGEVLSGTFSKRFPGTKVIATVQASSYVNTGGVLVDWGLKIDGTDYLIVNGLDNEASSHQSYCMTMELEGIPAGELDVSLLARISGGFTLLCDVNDHVGFTLQESA